MQAGSVRLISLIFSLLLSLLSSSLSPPSSGQASRSGLAWPLCCKAGPSERNRVHLLRAKGKFRLSWTRRGQSPSYPDRGLFAHSVHATRSFSSRMVKVYQQNAPPSVAGDF